MENQKIEFEWDEIDDHDREIRTVINHYVRENIKEYYGVDHLGELTQEQMVNVLEFAKTIGDHSPIRIGLFNSWDEWCCEKEDLFGSLEQCMEKARGGELHD